MRREVRERERDVERSTGGRAIRAAAWLLALAGLVLIGAAGPVLAQQQRPGGSPQAGATDPARRCIEVQIGDEKSLDCFNQQFKREVDRVNPSLNLPPIGPASSDLQKGVVNVPAVQQQYGPNFGRSVVPFRPTTTYTVPVR